MNFNIPALFDKLKKYEGIILQILLGGSGYIFQLLIIKHLSKTLGVERFGEIMSAQSLVLILSVIVDYSYNLTASRNIVQIKEDTKKLSEYISSVYQTKSVLILISFLVLVVFIECFQFIETEKYMVYSMFGVVLSKAFYPNWFFQSVQKLRMFSLATIFGQGLSYILMFFLVHNMAQFYLVPFLFFIPTLLISLALLSYMKTHYNISLHFISYSKIIKDLRYDVGIFASNIATISYSNINLVIATHFLPAQELGYLSGVDKIINIFKQALSALSGALYPFGMHLYHTDSTRYLHFFNKVYYILIFVPILLFTSGVFIYAEEVTRFFNVYSEPSVLNLRITLPSIILMTLYMPLINKVIVMGTKDSWIWLLYGVAILNIILNLTLASTLGSMGTSIAILVTEVLLFIGWLFLLLRK